MDRKEHANLAQEINEIIYAKTIINYDDFDGVFSWIDPSEAAEDIVNLIEERYAK